MWRGLSQDLPGYRRRQLAEAAYFIYTHLDTTDLETAMRARNKGR